jgi:phosphatidylglycerophosphate synthase
MGLNPEHVTRCAQVLDMVTDRLSTAGLLAVLGMLYPRSYMVFLAIMFLDIFSHWFQMYSTFISGSETHKVGPRAGLLALVLSQAAQRAQHGRLGLRPQHGEHTASC